MKEQLSVNQHPCLLICSLTDNPSFLPVISSEEMDLEPQLMNVRRPFFNNFQFCFKSTESNQTKSCFFCF